MPQHPAGSGLLLPLGPDQGGALLGAGPVRAGLLAPQPGSRQAHRLDDLHIAGAAAVVGRQRLADLLLSGVRYPIQQGLCGKHHARGAKAALYRTHIQKGLLDGMQAAVRPLEALDGEHCFALHTGQRHHAGVHRPPVQQNGTGPALAGAAAVLGSVQAGRSPQILQQALALVPGGDRAAVQFKSNLGHPFSSSLRKGLSGPLSGMPCGTPFFLVLL